jgi:hypothetical protein
LGACGSIGRRGAATGGRAARALLFNNLTRLPERLIGSSLLFIRLFGRFYGLLPGRMFGPGVTMYASLQS